MPKSQWISKSGKTYKKQNPLNRFKTKYKVDSETGCWNWIASTRSGVGYGQFSLGNYPELSHRASWRLHNGEIPGDLEVLHKCDNKKCVNPEHLFLGTQLDNITDMLRKERDALRGERNPAAKLTWGAVKEIRISTKTDRALGYQFGVSRATINDVRKKRTWNENN